MNQQISTDKNEHLRNETK